MSKILFSILLLLCMTSTFLYASEEGTVLEKGITSLHKGITSLHKGDYKGCIDSCKSFLQLRDKMKNVKGRAEAHYWLAQCYFELRRYDESLKHAGESAVLYASLDDKGGLISANALLVRILIKRQDYREAHRLVEVTQKLINSGTNTLALIDFLTARGEYYLVNCCELDLAAKSLRAAQQEAKKINDPAREVKALAGLTLAYVLDKKFEKAREAAYSTQRCAFENNVGPYLQAKSYEACRLAEMNEARYDEALKNELSAKVLYKLTGNVRCEANTLSTIGYIYKMQKEIGKSDSIHDEALELFKSDNDVRGLIREYRYKASRIQKEDKDASVRRDHIIGLLREIADRERDYRIRIEALTGIRFMMDRDEKSASIVKIFDEIAEICHNEGDTKGEIKALMEKAFIFSLIGHGLGRFNEALALYDKSLLLYKSLGTLNRLDDPEFYPEYSLGKIYQSMAMTYSQSGEVTKAIEYYKKAAEYNIADGKTSDVVDNYTMIVRAGLNIYDIEITLDAFDKALAYMTKIEDPGERSHFFDLIIRSLWRGEKTTLRDSLSTLIWEKILKDKELLVKVEAAYQDGIEQCKKHREFRESIARERYAKWALMKKDYTRARDEYETVLSLAKEEGDLNLRSRSTSSLAEISLLLGNPEKAVGYAGEEIEIYKKLYKGAEWNAMYRMADILKRSGKEEEAKKYSDLAEKIMKEHHNASTDLEKAVELWKEAKDGKGALQYYEKALAEARRFQRKREEAEIVDDIGEIAEASADLKRAVECYRKALSIYEGMGDLYKISNATLHCGMALEKQNLEKEALAAYLGALDRITSQWTHQDSVIAHLKFSSNSLVITLFDRAIKILIKSGRNDEALKYLELSHSLSLLESIKLDELKLKDQELQSLLSRFTMLRQKMSLIAGELSQPCEEKRKGSLKEILVSTRQDFFTTINSIKSKNPDFDQLLSVRSSDLAAMQRMLPKGVLLVEYYPSSDVLYIFGITSDSFIIRKSGVSRERLYEAIKEYRNKITRPDGGNFREEKKYLYSKLLDPLKEEMAKSDRMIIVPGGLLWYLPFEALGSSDESYIIETKPLSYLSSANVLNLIANKAAGDFKGKKMLAFGAPPEAGLPGAENELKRIASLYPGSVSCTGSSATKENFFSNVTKKSVIHIASHSSLDAADINNSYIELAGLDGKLYLGEIYGLLLNPSCLVALSSCQSALGEENPGREFASLASAFTTAGASTVIASQWRVEDYATAMLFTEFYGSLDRKESRSEALREAKISLLRNRKTSHPFYWAPFVMLGDWR